MAWNEPGGGRRNPWGDGGGGGNRQEPPDLEEMLRQMKQRFNALFGGGKGGRRSEGESPAGGLGWVILGVVVLWALFDSVHIIDQRERGVVLRFGEVDRILEPGPRLTLPRPIEEVRRLDVTQVRSITAEAAMLTRDENLVSIDFAVQYTVSDASAFLFNVRDPEETLSHVAESAVRQVIGSRTLDDVQIGNRLEFTSEAREITQKLLDSYEAGIAVSLVNFQEVVVPEQVKDAFDDAIKAREDQQRIINEARAYASKVEPEAKGRAARIQQEAEAYRESVVARAEGDAQRFALLVQEYRRAPEVTRKRLYLETMQDVLSRTPKVLIDKDQGNNMLYLPLDKLVPGAAVPPPVSDRNAQMSAGEGR